MALTSGFSGRAKKIAQMLVAHAREDGDVGDLLAAALRLAASQSVVLDDDGQILESGDVVLLAARPGSWEAELVRQLAGGWEYDVLDGGGCPPHD